VALWSHQFHNTSIYYLEACLPAYTPPDIIRNHFKET
jgi:hypothetical protein